MSDLVEQIEKDIKNGETADKAHYFIRKAVINKIIDALREHDRMQTIADDNLKAAADKAGIAYMGCDTPDALAERIAELAADKGELSTKLYLAEQKIKRLESRGIEDMQARIAELEDELKLLRYSSGGLD